MLKEIQRKITHLIGLVIPILYHYADNKRFIVVGLIFVTWLFLCLEIFRYVVPDFNSSFLKFLSPILRSHEKRGKVLGSTYFVLSSLLSVILFPQKIAVACITFLGLGDLFAAIIGKKWGRIRILSGKSLEGSLACFVTCFVVSILVIKIKPIVGLFGAVAATAFELIPIGIDDNLTVPLMSGFVMWTVIEWASL